MSAGPGQGPDLQDAALSYARAGWPVFPLTPGGKEPAIPSAHSAGSGAGCRGECGRDGHGVHDATTDPARIGRWWETNPRFNIGVATGKPGPDVVDVDVKPDGRSGVPAWHQLQRAGLVSGAHAIVRTPGTGFHAYYQGTSQGNGRLPAHHLDFRSTGGYVVAPPSSDARGPYVLVRHEKPGGATVSWSTIRERLDPPQRHAGQRAAAGRDDPGTDLDRLVEWTASRQAGDRNFPLFYAAKQAAIAGKLDSPAVERFVDAARRNGLEGGEREARRTIASAQRSADEAHSPRPFGRSPQRQIEAGS